MRLIFSLGLLALSFSLQAESITGNYIGYRDICKKASVDPAYFNKFRSFAEYRCALELSEGDAFCHYIQGSPKLLEKLNVFRKLDSFGSPFVQNYPGLGIFSATTLRYIVIADQIQKFFRLPQQATIVEIGAGFGGQCYILSQLQSVGRYYIYDLPEVEALISKVMETLRMKTTQCIPMEKPLPEKSVDLLISNYAFSEIDRKTQLDYFERVIKKAERGFVIFNHISKEAGIHSLSLDEFLQLLKANGCRPKTFNEFLSTGEGNRIVIWDKSKQK